MLLKIVNDARTAQRQMIQAVKVRLRRLLGLAVKLKDYAVVARLSVLIQTDKPFIASDTEDEGPVSEVINDMLFENTGVIELCEDMDYLCEMPTLVEVRGPEYNDEILLHETLMCSDEFRELHLAFYMAAYESFKETMTIEVVAVA